MAEDKTTRILKNAILLEKRGQAFYQKVAQQTSSSAVKRFFEVLAAEEENHIQTLAEQFKTYQSQGKFDPQLFGNDRFLADIDRELTENIWYDQNFWPF
ncbi:MAG: ferritin family protein [Desulfobacterales bacterium]